MDVIILDPNLEVEGGHHLFYDSSLAREIGSRGCNVRIIANVRFPRSEIGGVPVMPHFQMNGYPPPPGDLIRGAFDAFKERNDSIFADLCALPTSLFPPGCLVVMPTVNEYLLYGIMRWCELHPAASSPLFVVWLMLPSGAHVEVGGDEVGRLSLLDPVQALLYRLALDIGKSLPGRVAFFGSGGAHAREYSAIAGTEMKPHPIIMNIDPQTVIKRDPKSRRILLFAGDAKIDKGLALVPSLAREIRRRNPDWEVVIHANFTSAWGKTMTLLPELEALAAEDAGIHVAFGMISREAYAEMMMSCDVAAFTYDPVKYKRKSSGVLWEAIALGVPVIAPAGTWLYEEVEEWRGVVSGYSDWSVAPIADAIDAILPGYASLQTIAARAGARFRERNNVVSAVDQIFDCWIGNAWLRSSLSVDGSVVLTMDEVSGPGWSFVEWHGANKVRWASESATFTAELPAALEWLIKISGPDSVDGNIVHEAELYVNDSKIATEAIQGEDRSWQLAGSWAPERAARMGSGLTRAKITLRTPLSETPEGETRSLSLLVSSIEFLNSQSVPRRELPPEADAPINLTSGELRPIGEGSVGASYEVGAEVRGQATFPFAVNSQIVFELDCAMQRVEGKLLQVEVNGVSVPVRFRPAHSGCQVTAEVPASLLLDARGRVEVEMKLPAALTAGPRIGSALDAEVHERGKQLVLSRPRIRFASQSLGQ